MAEPSVGAGGLWGGEGCEMGWLGWASARGHQSEALHTHTRSRNRRRNTHTSHGRSVCNRSRHGVWAVCVRACVRAHKGDTRN